MILFGYQPVGIYLWWPHFNKSLFPCTLNNVHIWNYDQIVLVHVFHGFSSRSLTNPTSDDILFLELRDNNADHRLTPVAAVDDARQINIL